MLGSSSPRSPRTRPRRQHGALVVAALGLWPCLAGAQQASLPAQTPPQSSDAADLATQTSAPGASTAQASERLYAHLELSDTELSETEVRAALAAEFRVPVEDAEGPGGLHVVVHAEQLSVSYVDIYGARIERHMQLPQDKQQQLSTIALLSGSLARDEAGALLALLTVPDPPLPPIEESPATPEPAQAPAAQSAEAPEQQSNNAEQTKKDAANEGDEGDDDDEDDEDETSPLASELAGSTPFSFSFAGDLSFPPNLKNLQTNAELGAFYSHIGSLRGVGANFLVVNNRGLGPRGSSGVQLALAASINQTDFRGVLLSLGFAGNFATYRGVMGSLVGSYIGQDLYGVQFGALGSYVKGNTQGLQLGVVGAMLIGDTRGAQLGVGMAYSKGKLTGLQLGLGASIGWSNLHGAQAAVFGSITREKLEGFQMAFANYAGELDGFQMALVNTTKSRMHGGQWGLLNIAGDIQGTQVGLINVGGSGKGNMIGLINVARKLDGVALAPINILPKVRNQLLSYVSYSTGGKFEGLPAGPMYHLGLKVMPSHFYTQLSLGLGPEAQECVTADECYGKGVVYAPAFAVGARADWTRWFYTDFDVQYEFEKGFSQSRSLRHGLLGRVALGAQLTPAVALFVGGGPRVDLREGPRVSPSPEVRVGGHGFAGLAFF